MINETTRCYPRTLHEAFDSREWLEHHPRHSKCIADMAVYAACAVGLVAAIVAALCGVAA